LNEPVEIRRLGFEHSADPTSAMFGGLAAGIARRLGEDDPRDAVLASLTNPGEE